jgi:hypothetical protein
MLHLSAISYYQIYHLVYDTKFSEIFFSCAIGKDFVRG